MTYNMTECHPKISIDKADRGSAPRPMMAICDCNHSKDQNLDEVTEVVGHLVVAEQLLSAAVLGLIDRKRILGRWISRLYVNLYRKRLRALNNFVSQWGGGGSFKSVKRW